MITALEAAAAQPGAAHAELITLQMHGDRQLQQLRASAEVVTEVRRWVGQILVHKTSDPPLFVAANMDDTLGKAAVRSLHARLMTPVIEPALPHLHHVHNVCAGADGGAPRLQHGRRFAKVSRGRHGPTRANARGDLDAGVGVPGVGRRRLELRRPWWWWWWWAATEARGDQGAVQS